MIRSFITGCAGGCSTVLFLPPGKAGWLILTVVLLTPRVGLAGLLAVIAAHCAAALWQLDTSQRQNASYFYNPFLTGLAIGHGYDVSVSMLLITMLAGIAAWLMTAVCSQLLQNQQSLPVLSMPFVGTSFLVYLAIAPNPTAAFAPWVHPGVYWLEGQLPSWLAGFFGSLGAVFFMPHAYAGIVLTGIIGYRSRVLLLLAILGYGTSVFFQNLLCGDGQILWRDSNHFNGMLTAMALGGVFLVPSLSSYGVAITGAAISSLMLCCFDSSGIIQRLPPLALPFNVAALGVLFALRSSGYTKLVRLAGATPEETLQYDVINRHRFPGSTRCVFLPFNGSWVVWQGFRGRWTHQGRWQYACDFIITDSQGNAFDEDSGRLENFYCYRKPVLSPIDGRVVRVVSHLPDCEPGKADYERNWGNLVVLWDQRGFYVEISHFAADSIRVAVGDEVTRGTVLGLCGNSGNSPQPHIHIQVQGSDQVGAETLPFSFASYVSEGRYFANDVPVEGQWVEPLWPDPQLVQSTSFHLDQVLEFELQRGERRARQMRLTVKMATDGTFFFESDLGGRLYFGKHADTFHCYRIEGQDVGLRLLMLAVPRLPLGLCPGLAWEDCLPAAVVLSGWRRWFVQIAGALYPESICMHASQHVVSHNQVLTSFSSWFGEGLDVQLRLDARRELEQVIMSEWTLTRKTSTEKVEDEVDHFNRRIAGTASVSRPGSRSSCPV